MKTFLATRSPALFVALTLGASTAFAQQAADQTAQNPTATNVRHRGSTSTRSVVQIRKNPRIKLAEMLMISVPNGKLDGIARATHRATK